MLQYLQEVFTEYLCFLSPKGGKKTIVRLISMFRVKDCYNASNKTRSVSSYNPIMTIAANTTMFTMPYVALAKEWTRVACPAQGAWESLTFPESPAHSTNPLHQALTIFQTTHVLTQSKLESWATSLECKDVLKQFEFYYMLLFR